MNRLRAYRDIEGINQAELADILDLSVPMISAIESGCADLGSSEVTAGDSWLSFRESPAPGGPERSRRKTWRAQLL